MVRPRRPLRRTGGHRRPRRRRAQPAQPPAGARRPADLLRLEYHGGGGSTGDYLGSFSQSPHPTGVRFMTRWLYLSIALTVAALAGTLYIYFAQYEQLPDPIPTHWDIHFEPDG